MAIGDAELFFREIAFCLLSRNYFKACGRDFGRKLHAILVVIERGDWQTPSELVLKEEQETASILASLHKEFREAQAEIHHFQRLLASSSEDAKKHLNAIIQNAQNKMVEAESSLRQFQLKTHQTASQAMN